MARRISVEIVGDASSLERSFSRAGTATRGFESGLLKTSRGAIAATFSFHGLGRAVTYASGELLAGAGLISALKEVTSAAEEHQVVEAQLANAVRTSGKNYAEYASQIQGAIKAQENLGFSEDATTKSFTLALRATGSVAGANRLLAVSGNLARGSNKDLYTSTLTLVRAYDGATTGLKRLGIEVKKGSTGYDVLNQVQGKYAGAAVAYSNSAAGAQARLTVAIHQTAVTIGTALLPTIAQLSGKIATWLDDSKHQKEIQQDVNIAVKDGTAFIQGLTSGFRGVKAAVEPFLRTIDKLTPSVNAFKGAGEAAFGGALLIAINGMRKSILTLLTDLKLIGPATVASSAKADAALVTLGGTATATAGEVAGIGTAATVAGGEVVALGGMLGKLKLLAAGAFGLFPDMKNVSPTVGGNIHQGKNGKDYITIAGNNYPITTGKGAPLITGLSAPQGGGTTNPYADVNRFLKKLGNVFTTVFPDNTNAVKAAAAANKKFGAPISSSQQLALGLANDPNNLGLLKQKKSQDDAAITFLKKERADGTVTTKKYIAELSGLYSDRSSVESQISSIQSAAAAKIKSAADKARAAAKAAAAAALREARKRTAEETASALAVIPNLPKLPHLNPKDPLGVKTFALPFAAQLAEARAATTATVSDDLKVARAERSYAQRALKSGNLRGQAILDALGVIASVNSTLATSFAVPARLQVAAAKAGTTVSLSDDRKVAAATKTFVEKMIKSGRLQGQALIDAYNTIAAANSTLATTKGTFGVPLKLQLAVAKAGITADTGDDRKAAQQIKTLAEKLLHSHKLSLQGQIDAYDTIAQENQVLGTKLAVGAKAVSAHTLTAGLGLTRVQRVALEQRTAQALAHGGHVPTGIGAQGHMVLTGNTIHLHGIQDPKQLADALQKVGKRTSVTTVGRNAGRSRALP